MHDKRVKNPELLEQVKKLFDERLSNEKIYDILKLAYPDLKYDYITSQRQSYNRKFNKLPEKQKEKTEEAFEVIKKNNPDNKELKDINIDDLLNGNFKDYAKQVADKQDDFEALTGKNVINFINHYLEIQDEDKNSELFKIDSNFKPNAKMLYLIENRKLVVELIKLMKG